MSVVGTDQGNTGGSDRSRRPSRFVDFPRETLENEWDSDLARDVSRGLPGVTVCGLRTFGLVGDRIPVLGTLIGNREATDSNAILGSKACYIDGKEAAK